MHMHVSTKAPAVFWDRSLVTQKLSGRITGGRLSEGVLAGPSVLSSYSSTGLEVSLDSIP